MKYSNLHRSKNPISAARLDEAFKASKLEGGPSDPVSVDIKKDHAAGEVTIKKSYKGKKPQLSDQQKKEANTRWANMSEEDKQAARDRKSKREGSSSFTYKKLKTLSQPDFEIMDEDFDVNASIEEIESMESGLTENKETVNNYGGYTTSRSRGNSFDGSGMRKVKRSLSNVKAKCKQGFFNKGNKCVSRGEKSIKRQLRKR